MKSGPQHKETLEANSSDPATKPKAGEGSSAAAPCSAASASDETEADEVPPPSESAQKTSASPDSAAEEKNTSGARAQKRPLGKSEQDSESAPKKVRDPLSTRSELVEDIRYDLGFDSEPPPPADTGLKGEVLELSSPDESKETAPKNAFSDLEMAFFEQDLEEEQEELDTFEDLFGHQPEPQSVWDWLKQKTTGQPPKTAGRAKHTSTGKSTGSSGSKKQPTSSPKKRAGSSKPSSKKKNSPSNKKKSSKKKGSKKKKK
jgi:hypothetical protein